MSSRIFWNDRDLSQGAPVGNQAYNGSDIIIGMAIAHITFQERAYLRRSGHRRLDDAFRECATLYNAALEHWQTAWKHGHSVSLYEQCRELTAIRHDDAYWGGVGVQVGRGVLRRLDRARQAFYGRCKAGEEPGYPRFRSSRRWKTIEIAQPIASMITSKRGKWVVKVKGLPILVIKPRRDLPDSTKLKTLSITRKPTGVYVSLGYEVEKEALPKTDRIVGLDMGVLSRIALSDGSFVDRRQVEYRTVTDIQRRIERCKKGSGNQRKLYRQLARLRHRESVRNRNECHRITTELVRHHDFIAVEDLRIDDMTRSARGTAERPGRNVSAKSGLNRNIIEQSWGIIAAQLQYKTQWYGREFVKVDSKYTSQMCSGCGVVASENRQDKLYNCGICGLGMDADTNAAINILRRGLSSTGAGIPPGLAA